MEENNEKNILNMKSNPKCTGSKSTNFATMPKTEDIAVVEGMLLQNPEEKPEVQQEDIEKALVYTNEVTSLDFMMPENEKEILKENLNIYNDLEATKKALTAAKINKKLSEDIKTLKIISDSTETINKLGKVLTDEASVNMLLKSFREKAEKGDSAKAYKELATAYKLFIDAREEMTKRLTNNGNKKNAKIALKFTNDNGESFELGADL